MDTVFYSPMEFAQDIDNILHHIKHSGIMYDMVAGIPRGGLIPGVCLSHALGVRFESLNLQVLDYIDRNPDMRLLIVDDIVDGGKTLHRIENWYENTNASNSIDFATLIYNTAQVLVKPKYFGHSINRNLDTRYIEFFWEKY